MALLFPSGIAAVVNEISRRIILGPQHHHFRSPELTKARDRLPSLPSPAPRFSALIAWLTHSGAYTADNNTHNITALNSWWPSVPASREAVATMNANSPHALMANPILEASTAVSGLANRPVATLPNAAIMNTAALVSTGAVHRSRIGTSNPMVHAKKTRMSHERIFSTCWCHTVCMDDSEQKHSPPRNAPRRCELLP